MRKWILFIFLILFSIAGLVSQYAPCAQPTGYSIGSIDPQFGVTQEDFLTKTQEASQIWGTYDGAPLFQYDPQAELSINLVYDERQQLTTQLNTLDSDIDAKKQSYEERMREFKSQEAEFQNRVEKFNEQVAYWNRQGGAPPDEFDKLTKEHQALQEAANNLNAMAADLNTSVSSFNAEINTFNETVNTFNTKLGEKPEQGLYDGKTNRIDIYFSRDDQELIHTLAHELGHARGVGHTVYEDSVMYPYTNTITKLSSEDRVLLQGICRKRMYLEVLLERVEFISSLLRNQEPV